MRYNERDSLNSHGVTVKNTSESIFILMLYKDPLLIAAWGSNILIYKSKNAVICVSIN